VYLLQAVEAAGGFDVSVLEFEAGDWFELVCPTCAIEYEGYGDPVTECTNCGTELIEEEDML
jgi:hypothetical protein